MADARYPIGLSIELGGRETKLNTFPSKLTSRLPNYESDHILIVNHQDRTLNIVAN